MGGTLESPFHVQVGDDRHKHSCCEETEILIAILEELIDIKQILMGNQSNVEKALIIPIGKVQEQ